MLTLHLDEPEVELEKVVVTHRRRKVVDQQEAEMAAMVGGRKQAGSGSVLGCKGDVRKKGVFRIECKSTEAQSFSLKRELLDKIRSECAGTEEPAFDIKFLNKATLQEEDRWVAIPYTHFEDYASHRSRKKK
jgi:hypothetical protein